MCRAVQVGPVSRPGQRDSKKKERYNRMYAILETGGKQYRVSEGDVIYVEKLGVDAEQTVTFDKVLAVGEGQELKGGAPDVEGATVSAKVEKNGRGKKVRILKYAPKKGYRKRQGQGQPYTKVVMRAIRG